MVFPFRFESSEDEGYKKLYPNRNRVTEENNRPPQGHQQDHIGLVDKEIGSKRKRNSSGNSQDAISLLSEDEEVEDGEVNEGLKSVKKIRGYEESKIALGRMIDRYKESAALHEFNAKNTRTEGSDDSIVVEDDDEDVELPNPHIGLQVGIATMKSTVSQEFQHSRRVNSGKRKYNSSYTDHGGNVASQSQSVSSNSKMKKQSGTNYAYSTIQYNKQRRSCVDKTKQEMTEFIFEPSLSKQEQQAKLQQLIEALANGKNLPELEWMATDFAKAISKMKMDDLIRLHTGGRLTNNRHAKFIEYKGTTSPKNIQLVIKEGEVINIANNQMVPDDVVNLLLQLSWENILRSVVKLKDIVELVPTYFFQGIFGQDQRGYRMAIEYLDRKKLMNNDCVIIGPLNLSSLVSKSKVKANQKHWILVEIRLMKAVFGGRESEKNGTDDSSTGGEIEMVVYNSIKTLLSKKLASTMENKISDFLQYYRDLNNAAESEGSRNEGGKGKLNLKANYPEVPQQRYGSLDCGFYVMKYFQCSPKGTGEISTFNDIDFDNVRFEGLELLLSRK